MNRVYSGVCLCGHDDSRHHGQFSLRDGARIPGTCLAYGHNESAGLGPDGEAHCFGYVDATDPDVGVRAGWHGTVHKPN